MATRFKRLLALAFIIVSISLYFGCSQPEDIIGTKTETVFHLNEERLPTNPPGLIYGLCVAENFSGEQVDGLMCFAEFGYDFDTRTWLNVDGTTRTDSNRFVLDADALNYHSLMVVVKRVDGTDPDGWPIMLVDHITDPYVDAIELGFPRFDDTLGNSVAYYHMQPVSDDTGIAFGQTTTDPIVKANTFGAAMWFNTVFLLSGSVQDTTDLLNWSIEVDSVEDLGDKECVTSVTEVFNIRDTVLRKGFGLDTLEQVMVLYDVTEITECIDSHAPPYVVTDLTFEWQTGALHEFIYADHLQIGNHFRSLSDLGWSYQGWIVTPAIAAAGASVGNMTPPAWIGYNSGYDSLIPGIMGGMISTGTFDVIEASDDSDPYILDDHITPPFPGEDFMQNLPNGVAGPLMLVPGDGTTGSVFISVEPSNRINDTTNFPLIVNLAELPTTRNAVEQDSQSFAMRNYANINQGAGGEVLIGFPIIRVDMVRR